jgi:predicted DNA-binding transcriptional regulator AlpA
MDTTATPANNADSSALKLLSEKEAAELLGFSPRALQNWRTRGGGPRYVKISNRAVRYRPQDLSAWISSQVCESTSQPPP